MRRLVLAALVLPGILAAQIPSKRGGTDVRSRIITQAILPEFAARFTPYAIIESWSETNPCTPHSHNYVVSVSVWRRAGALPDPTAALYRDGAQVESWTIMTPTGGDTTIALGKFTWTADHPCPGGGTSIGPGPQPNYRLVVDPANKVAEQSESNNSITFYVNPSASFTRLP